MAWYRCGMNGTYNATTVSRSGAICNYVANVGGVPLSRFIANITPIQEGSGDTSPINIRAIIGVSAVNVCDTPMPVSPLWTIDSSFNGMVNFNQQINKDYFPATTTINGVTFTNNADGSITVDGTALSLASYVVLTNQRYTPISGHRYFLRGCPEGGSDSTYRMRFTSGSISELGDGKIFTGGVAVNLTCQVMSGYAISGTLTFKPMLIDLTQMFGSTIADYIYSLEQATAGAGVAFFKSIYPDDYYEYDAGTNEMVGSREGQTATINLGGTFYVGTLNVLTGLLTVMGLLTTYDKNSSWTRNASGVFYTDAPSGIDDLHISNMFECFLPKGSSNALADGQCRLNVASTYINFKATSCDTVEEFKALLGDNTIQIVYTLATPVEYQLTPAQITQLLGENNVWADSGDSEVDFFKIIRT